MEETSEDKEAFRGLLNNFYSDEQDGRDEDELLEDIPSKDIVPNHQLLNQDEKEELLKYFQAKSFKKIYEYDIMSRYYGAVPGDIFRIERFNTTSGKGIDYRTVIPGKYDIMF